MKPDRKHPSRQPPPRPGAPRNGPDTPARASKAMLHPKHLAWVVVAILVIGALFYSARNGRQRPFESPPGTNAAPGAAPASTGP